MNSPTIESKTCQCGEQVPANCVRCRFCGDFLYEQTRQFHEENIARNEVAEWMVTVGQQQFGPLSTEALRQSLATHQVPPQAMVWKQGLSGWIEAHRVPELWPQTISS
ncbi:MAG: DUF4339 domain-containing protein [Planctomycetaceae bacterium]